MEDLLGDGPEFAMKVPVKRVGPDVALGADAGNAATAELAMQPFDGADVVTDG